MPIRSFHVHGIPLNSSFIPDNTSRGECWPIGEEDRNTYTSMCGIRNIYMYNYLYVWVYHVRLLWECIMCVSCECIMCISCESVSCASLVRVYYVHLLWGCIMCISCEGVSCASLVWVYHMRLLWGCIILKKLFLTWWLQTLNALIRLLPMCGIRNYMCGCIMCVSFKMYYMKSIVFDLVASDA